MRAQNGSLSDLDRTRAAEAKLAPVAAGLVEQPRGFTRVNEYVAPSESHVRILRRAAKVRVPVARAERPGLLEPEVDERLRLRQLTQVRVTLGVDAASPREVNRRPLKRHQNTHTLTVGVPVDAAS